MLKRAGAVLVLLAVCVPALTVHLATCPAPWYDEGTRTQVARTLIEHGVYGTSTVEGDHPFDPLSSTGPVDIFAVAASFRAAGVGMAQARLPIALFALLSVLLLYAIACWLWGDRAALFAVLVVLAMPRIQDTSLLLLGRQVMGEAPALALALLSLGLLFHAIARDRPWAAALAGAAAVLSVFSKVQIAFGLLPALAVGVLLASAAGGYRWARTLALVSGGALTAGAWRAAELASTSPALQHAHAAIVIEGLRFQLLTLAPRRLPPSAWWAAALIGVGVACQTWRTSDGWRRRPVSARQCAERVLLVFVVCAGGWFITLSIGWPRYSFAAVVMAQLLVGQCAYELFERLCRTQLPAPIAKRAYPAAIAVVALCAAAVNLVPLWRCPQENFVRQVADYVRDTIPRSAVVESVEWEVDALSTHWNFHHPAQRYEMAAIEQFSAGVPFDLGYEALQADPDYLLTGPFSDWVRLYPWEVRQRSFRLLATFGPYRVYARTR